MSLTDTSTELAQGFMDQLRLPMLTIPSKQGVSVDLTSPLAELIRNEYGEDPTHFRPEVRELNQLRDYAIRPSRDNNGTSAVRRYYAQLSLLPTRFASTRSSMQVTFIWGDAFTEKETAENLVQFEMSAVLFNLGALHSRLGSDLQDELRGACTHFQCAAGAFYLLQSATNFTPTPNQCGDGYSIWGNSFLKFTGSLDMSAEVLAFCKNLMLAQAQECMVEKSLLERKRPSLVSKVAWEVSTLYQKAIDILDLQVGAQLLKKNKTWQKFLQTKFHIYQSVANFCQALTLEENANYGQAIAYFQVAMECIQAGNKTAKSQLPPVKTAVKYLADLIQSKSVSAAQANQQVYHQLVPSIPDLEAIQGALLVKPIEFSVSDKSVIGNDIFSKLVPMSVLEANSMYSEEKANLLRSVCATIQERNKDLAEYLSKMNLEEVLSYKDNKTTIPTDVSIIRTEVTNEQQGRVEGMDALLHSVLQMSNQIHRKLDEICMYLTRDTPEVANQIQEFQKQADKIDEYLIQGDKSNQELHEVMKELKPKLTLLSVPESTFMNSLPKLDLVSLSFDEQSENRLAMLVGKVEEMQTQRSSLEKQLRTDMDSDDISVQLITSPDSNRDKLFESAMTRHKQTSALIRQNCEAQDNIMMAMTDTNANLAGLRKELISVRSEREVVYKGLLEAWKRLGSTEESLKDGMKFYQNLDKRTSKLFETIKSSLPPPPLQQPIKTELSKPPTLSPNTSTQSDTSYKPISPFQALPSDTSRPPVPSRRLKPNVPEQPDETKNIPEESKNIIEEAKISIFPPALSDAIISTDVIISTDAIISTENVDDDELALLNWVEVKQDIPEQQKIVKPVPQTPIKDSSQSLASADLNLLMSTNQIAALAPQPHIPPAQPIATESLDTSHLSQLIQSNQLELGTSMVHLQNECRSISQSVLELSQNVAAVVNQTNQSTAAISSLTQVSSGHSSSLEQLSSHLQTANQNVVFTSQLVKQVETNLLAKIESVEKTCQDSIGRIDQLFQHVTQKQQDVVLKIEPLFSKISESRSADSEEIQSLKSSLDEVREEIRHIRNKQDSMVLLPSQSESRPTSDPLSLQNRHIEGPNRPTEDPIRPIEGTNRHIEGPNRHIEGPSQVEQLWNLLDSKSAVPKKSGLVQPSENTAFSPVTPGPDRNVKNRPSSAFQLASLDNQLSTNPMQSQFPAQIPNISQSSFLQNPRSLPPAISQSDQSVPSLVPTAAFPSQSMVQTHSTALQSQKSLPLVPSTPKTHEMPPQIFPVSQPIQTQHPPRSVYPPQIHQVPLLANLQPNQSLPIQSNQSAPFQSIGQPNQTIPFQSIGQPNQTIPFQSIGQPNQTIPLQSLGQPNQSIPLQATIQSTQQVPLQHSLQASLHPTLQSHPSATLQPTLQSNPQIPTAQLNPQQHAYLQMLQKQLTSTSSTNLTPEQLISIQKHLQSLS